MCRRPFQLVFREHTQRGSLDVERAYLLHRRGYEHKRSEILYCKESLTEEKTERLEGGSIDRCSYHMSKGKVSILPFVQHVCLCS